MAAIDPFRTLGSRENLQSLAAQLQLRRLLACSLPEDSGVERLPARDARAHRHRIVGPGAVPEPVREIRD